MWSLTYYFVKRFIEWNEWFASAISTSLMFISLFFKALPKFFQQGKEGLTQNATMAMFNIQNLDVTLIGLKTMWCITWFKPEMYDKRPDL